MIRHTNKLISSSIVVVAGTIIASFFSYLFNMAMGRMLGPKEYGEFATILSLLAILSVSGGAILIIAMRYASELYTLGQNKKLKEIYSIMIRYTLLIETGVFLLALLLIARFSSFLLIDNKFCLTIMFFGFFVSFFYLVNKGFLQGIQKFFSLSVISTLEMIFRMIVGIALVKVGLGISGAVGAVVLSMLLFYIVTLISLSKIFSLPNRKMTSTFSISKKEVMPYCWPAIGTSVLLAIGLNIDIILVKHYFSPEEAGMYAAISTISKIIFYCTGPIASVMFPMVSENITKGIKHYNTFLLSLVLTVSFSVVILGFYILAPHWIVNVLYGSSYSTAYEILPYLGVAMLFYSLINLMVNYYLVIKKFLYLWAFFLLILVQVCLIHFIHYSIIIIVEIIVTSYGSLFFLMLGYYLFTKKEIINSRYRRARGIASALD